MKNYFNKITKFIKKNRKTSCDKSIELFKLLPEGLTFLDVGASGGIEPRWERVSKYLNYIGVESDSRSIEGLENKNIFKSTKIMNTFAWCDEKEIEFNLCKKPMVSSAYTPNRELLDQFQGSQRFEVLKKEVLRGTPLSKEIGGQEIDFVKLDIQGGELNALKGFGESLNSCLGLEIEVEFAEIYKSQPLFGDIHNYLSSKGFYFCEFLDITRWERYSRTDFGRCMFSNGLWMRELKTIESKDINTYLKYAAICSIYGRPEEAIHTTQLIRKEVPQEFTKTLKEQLKLQRKERRIFYLLRKLWRLYLPKSSIILFENSFPIM